MITEKEEQATLLSPTKKDYYQIWNELMDVAGKISDRWDPTSTNESDPGIVLLKLLTAVADKLNYNIDKNILEAFMPSASQEESMKKLCDMLGYNMKYFQSATTELTIAFTKAKADYPTDDDGNVITSLTIPKFTNIQNLDEDMNYFTLKDLVIDISSSPASGKVDCMQGSVCACETENDNIITLTALDDNYRYYLPENQIAENGIFIYTVSNGIVDSTEWTKVDNLNTRDPSTKVYKFGIDYKNNLPYIEFPDDISTIIEDGLKIFYTRTDGANGNISAGTLEKLDKPTTWSDTNLDSLDMESDFTVSNVSASTNGADSESLNQAYNNYKKTIGTFDTLVTCRDYANKIYQLTTSDTETTPLVSNVIVSDIRDDINKSITLCSFNDYGICYDEGPLKKVVTKTAITTKGESVEINSTESAIDNFNLMLYPFKTVYGLNTQREFKDSFKYTTTNLSEITSNLENYKTLAHNYINPSETFDNEDIVCIKNYLRLNAIITTTKKVTSTEESLILKNIYKNIYKNFNLRKLDFGENIPFDSILDCISNADDRIKNVSLNDPVLYTVYETATGEEYDLAAIEHLEEKYLDYPASLDEEKYNEAKENQIKAREIYNRLALRNILAGKLSLFNYDSDFSNEYSEKKSTIGTELVYPSVEDSEGGYHITSINSTCKVNLPATSTDKMELTLGPNEVISFRCQNLTTTTTYPAYTNYFAKINADVIVPTPATFQNLYTYMNDASKWEDRWTKKGSASEAGGILYAADAYVNKVTFAKEVDYNTALNTYNMLFTRTGDSKDTYEYTKVTSYSTVDMYGIPLNDSTFAIWYAWIQTQVDANPTIKLSGLYKQSAASTTRQLGKLVDSSKHLYTLATTYVTSTNPFIYYYVQATHDATVVGSYTEDGLGKDGALITIPKDCEYELKTDEYICINYTDEDSNAVNTVLTAGTIVKPNFDLIDSNQKHLNGTSYSKTSGYNFNDYGIKIDGMFSLGASEQIEVRKIVAADIGNTSDTTAALVTNTAYIYWECKNSDRNKEFFYDNEDSYILQDGEYFYYTDANMLDLAYYGSGTEISRICAKDYSLSLIKPDNSSEVTRDEITSLSISALPWIQVQVNKNKYLHITEYQYVNLVEGDTLESVIIDSSEEEQLTLDSNWKKIDSTCTTSYKVNGDNNSTELPLTSASNIYWQVRSSLDINCNPTTSQTIRKTSEFEDNILITLENNNKTNLVDLFGEASVDSSLSIKTNYICQTSSGEIDATTNSLGDEITDFKVKTFNINAPLIPTAKDGKSKSAISFNNFGNYWTEITFTNGVIDESFTTLNIAIPTKIKEGVATNTRFGLAMFYYIPNDSSVSSNPTWSVRIEEKDYSGNIITPEIYNLSTGWWKDYTSENKYYLKPGINIIRFNTSCTLDIYPGTDGSALKNGVLIFSSLDLVKFDEKDENKTGVNIANIGYYKINENISAYDQILADINNIDIDHNFYYNNIIDSGSMININSDAGESLATESILYDYNNVNNKFVISEIDSDYLSTGIVLSNSSKIKS